MDVVRRVWQNASALRTVHAAVEMNIA